MEQESRRVGAEDELVLNKMGANYTQVQDGDQMPGDVYMTENITNNESDLLKSVLGPVLGAAAVGIPLFLWANNAGGNTQPTPNPPQQEIPEFNDTDTKKELKIVRD